MKTRRHAVAFLRGITLAVAVSLALAATLWADPPKAAALPAPSMADAQSAYGHLPLSFEANQGQTDSQVNYLARGHGYTLLLTPSEALLSLRPPSAHSSASPSPSPSLQKGEGRNEGTMLRLQLLGATHTSTLRGVDELPGKANYFIGNNPETWRTNVPTFAKVTQPQVYPGIDVVYYGNPHQLEFDFIVAPGADPQVIKLKVDGADRLEMDAHGNLLLHVRSGDIQLQHPRVYQEIEGVRRGLSGHYVVNDTQEVSFQVAAYDTNRPLVIDPTLVYSTYLGGSGDDVGKGIAVDTAGSAYVTGTTMSTNFPTFPTASALQAAYGGGYRDVFVAKLNAAGTALVYSTYLSGSGAEDNNVDAEVGIAVDAAGNAYVTGDTDSTNFPTVNPLQATNAGSGDAFVAKLNAAGSALVYSTYLGGSAADVGQGIAVDAAGSAYVTGTTTSFNFPTSPAGPLPPLPLQRTNAGSGDAFVAKFNAAGSALVYSTYLGGGAGEFGESIAVDAAGNAYVTGSTNSTNFPTASPLQATHGGGILTPLWRSSMRRARRSCIPPTWVGTFLMVARALRWMPPGTPT